MTLKISIKCRDKKSHLCNSHLKWVIIDDVFYELSMWFYR